MQPLLTDLLATQTIQAPDGQTRSLHSYLPQFEGEILQAWIREFNCQNLLEIGLAYGISALFICEAMAPEATHTLIDPHQQTHWQGLGLHHLNQAGYGDRYRFYESPSELCLPSLLAQGETFDFAFIDGRHTFDQALVDFYFVNRLLMPTGIVIFDDIQLPAIQRVCTHVASYPCYQPLDLPAATAQTSTARVRRLAGLPPARIVGFQKIAQDQREHDWYADF